MESRPKCLAGALGVSACHPVDGVTVTARAPCFPGRRGEPAPSSCSFAPDPERLPPTGMPEGEDVTSEGTRCACISSISWTFYSLIPPSSFGKKQVTEAPSAGKGR